MTRKRAFIFDDVPLKDVIERKENVGLYVPRILEYVQSAIPTYRVLHGLVDAFVKICDLDSVFNAATFNQTCLNTAPFLLPSVCRRRRRVTGYCII